MASSSLSSSPTLPLLDCPIDIFEAIIHSLSPKDLHAMSLVCTAFCKLVEPLLYTRVQWTWVPDRSPGIIQFLRNISLRPQLAGHVQDVVLDGDNFYSIETAGRPPKIPVVEEELEGMIKFIEELNVPYGRVWIEELRYGTMDAFVAVLLVKLPNLKYLRMGPNFAKECKIVGMVLKSALCEPENYKLPAFQRLQDVSMNLTRKLDMFRGNYSRNTMNVLPLFYLPGVQHLSVSIENPATFEWPTKHMPTPSTLSSLDLNYIREDNLGEIISITKGLKTLRWNWHYQEGVENLYPVVDFHRILEALSHVRDTLTDLTISAKNYSPDWWLPTLTFNGSFHGICDFTSLKSLQVPMEFFMGYSLMVANGLEHVPRNIETLTLTDEFGLQAENSEMDYMILVRAIRSWLKDWKTYTPHLRSICLLLGPTIDEWDDDLVRMLKTSGTGAGVHVEVVEAGVPRQV